MVNPSLFDALWDLKRWLTPEVVVGALATVAALVTLGFVISEWRARRSQMLPRISATVRHRPADGWFRCDLNIRNRFDSPIAIRAAWVQFPRGFLLGRPRQQFDDFPAQETVEPNLKMDWQFVAAPQMEPHANRTLFLKPPRGFWLSRSVRPINIRFRISVRDEKQRDITVKAATNSVNWRV